MKRLFVLVLSVVALGALAAFTWRPGPPPREIVLIARGMAFSMPTPTPTPVPTGARLNPVLGLKAGERVRLVVRNEDRGFVHDLVIEGTSLRTRPLNFGESDALVFRVPRRERTTWYACSFHARMMRGRLVIQ